MSLNTIKLEKLKAYQALDRKKELIDSGLKMDIDFTWKYVPRHFVNESYVEFTFTDPSLCTFYNLLWK